MYLLLLQAFWRPCVGLIWGEARVWVYCEGLG